MIDVKIGIAAVAALSGVFALRTAFKSHRQLSVDIGQLQKYGRAKANIILNSATLQQKKSAKQEYQNRYLPLGHPNRNTTYKAFATIKINHADNLFSLKPQIDVILSNSSVFLNKHRRARLIALKNLLSDCETSYKAHNNKFALARCYDVREKLQNL
ncbi:hypothetical protein [Erwinia sp. ErVv1]|uniref:hypothetical protein n=1 Tax=Erwinia sp. ErVv1 TaxID=1603299 RepID=UPI00082A1763|nr:hypothetical protein [Erwinia sp. ErVv1]